MVPWSGLTPGRIEVLRLFLRGRSHTKPEVAARIQQSVPAAAAHVDALVEAGLITEKGMRAANGTVGRPATEYAVRSEAACGVGVEVRPGRVQTTVSGLDGTRRYGHTRLLKVNENQVLRSVIGEEVRKAVAACEDGARPIGVGLALPGTVDCRRGVLIRAPNLSVGNMQLKPLEQEIGLPVYVDNEANAAALAEHQLLSDPRNRSMVLISITEGVGGGIVVQGRLVHGETWRAGELGHMAIREGNRPCNCGRSGCWEQYVSEVALLREAGRVTNSTVTIEKYIDALQAQDPHAMAVWRRYVYSMAVGIENIAACFDPQLVLIGGAVARTGELPLEPLRHYLEAVSFLTKGLSVAVASLADAAPVYGAGLMAFGELYYGGADENGRG